MRQLIFVDVASVTEFYDLEAILAKFTVNDAVVANP